MGTGYNNRKIKIMAIDYKEPNFAVVVIKMLKHGQISGPSDSTTLYTSGVNIVISVTNNIHIGNIFLYTEIFMVISFSYSEVQLQASEHYLVTGFSMKISETTATN